VNRRKRRRRRRRRESNSTRLNRKVEGEKRVERWRRK
jgi:hypothetical protein